MATYLFVLSASQVIAPHTHKFMQRMQDEALFLALAQKVTKRMHTLQRQAVWCRSHLDVNTVMQISRVTAPSGSLLACLQHCFSPAHTCIRRCHCIYWPPNGPLPMPLQASAYLERKEDLRALPRIALRRIEHLYYKNDVVYDAMRRHVIAKQVRGHVVCGR